MCQKFIGYFKNIYALVCDQVHHLVTCTECIRWIKHIMSFRKEDKT